MPSPSKRLTHSERQMGIATIPPPRPPPTTTMTREDGNGVTRRPRDHRPAAAQADAAELDPDLRQDLDVKNHGHHQTFDAAARCMASLRETATRLLEAAREASACVEGGVVGARLARRPVRDAALREGTRGRKALRQRREMHLCPRFPETLHLRMTLDPTVFEVRRKTFTREWMDGNDADFFLSFLWGVVLSRTLFVGGVTCVFLFFLPSCLTSVLTRVRQDR